MITARIADSLLSRGGPGAQLEPRPTRVYVTRNTEYYVQDGRCVAVRTRCEGCRSVDHRAVGAPVLGAVRSDGALREGDDGAAAVGAGDHLLLGEPGNAGSVVTSEIVDVLEFTPSADVDDVPVVDTSVAEG